jgi:AcrR family transcriptional regulator
MTTQETVTSGRSSDVRERILDAAYDLFSRHGVRGVGIDAVIERSGVARMTLYRHFSSKETLALAFLQRREQKWSRDWLQELVEGRTSDPVGRLLGIFDAFDEWFQQDTFEGCAFISVLLETAGTGGPLCQASIECLARVRTFLAGLATEAGIPNPHDFAREWHILMKGCIVAAGEGDRGAARRARGIGEVLLKSRLPG